MNGKRATNGPLLALLTILAVFVGLFFYSSLNLKNIDYGYEMQELLAREKMLREEIDKLQAEQASLLNLQRVESVAIGSLGYQYPESGQIIKVFEDDHGR